MQAQHKRTEEHNRSQPRTKEEALARLIKEHPEKAAQIIRQVLQGRTSDE